MFLAVRRWPIPTAAVVTWLVLGNGVALNTGYAAGEDTTEKQYRRPVIEAPICEGPPLIDGVLDDPCWTQAYHTDEFWNTDDQCAPTERTEAWLCVDDEAFYVAVYAHDSQPQQIKAQETKRGGDIGNDDFVSVAIDPDHTGDRFYIFQATANGTQKERIPGGSDAKIEWRGDWSAAARIVDDGWTVEMRIPFAILRYPAGQSVWGVDIWRHHARTSNWFKWPPQPERWDNHEIAEIRGLNLPIIRVRPIIMPNVQSEWQDGHLRTKISLDAKYTHQSGLIGVMSLTPDFRNIEDEVESIDFSYTERWYSDRRPFFVEGGGYMPPGEMFYSRRIESFDLGMKLFGTVDRTSIGLLDAYSLAGRNDLALNIRQRIADQHGAVIGYVRTDQSGATNETYHLRGNYRKIIGRGSFRVSACVFQNYTEGSNGGTFWSVSAGRWQGPGKPGFRANYYHVDPTFDPWDGYVPDTDLEGFSAGVNFWDSFEERRTESYGVRLSWSSFNHTDGSRYHDDLGLRYWVDYRDGTEWSVSWSRSDRPPNLDRTWGVSLGWNSKKLHQGGGLGLTWGKRDGADYLYYWLGQGLKLNDKLYCTVGHEYRESDYPDGGENEDERIGRSMVSFNYDFTPEKTLGGRLLTGDLGTNFFVSYRQAVRVGTDLFVILGDPNADHTQSRLAVKTKWVYR